MDDIEELTPLKAALFESLLPRMQAEGFQRWPKRDLFVRQRGDIRDSLIIICIDAVVGHYVKPSVAMRFDRIETVFHQTSGFEKKYQKGTDTVGRSTGDLLDHSDIPHTRKGRYHLATMADVGPVTDAIMQAYHEAGPPFYKYWSSLAVIDAELNDKPEVFLPYISVPWFRCSKGLIAAKLVGRSNFEELVAFYTAVVANADKGFYLKWFQPLVASLAAMKSE